jgi:dihydrofolate synthase/folylpolyglutamate synthase
VAVGGQVVTIRGLAGRYPDLVLPLFGDHQAQNAAVAVAAVESFLGSGSQALDLDVLSDGLAQVTSPGRLQIVANDPTILVDAAHNPHGARALAKAVEAYFLFGRVVAVLSVLADKDAAGIVRALSGTVQQFVITQSDSDRSVPADELAAVAVKVVGADRVVVETDLAAALRTARDIADETEGERPGGVVVTGSITLVGDVLALAQGPGGLA